MVLVDGTVARASARVGEVAAHRALEEALASLARELPVVLARALVAAHYTLHAAARLLPAIAAARAAERRAVVVMMVLAGRGVVVGAGAVLDRGESEVGRLLQLVRVGRARQSVQRAE